MSSVILKENETLDSEPSVKRKKKSEAARKRKYN